MSDLAGLKNKYAEERQKRLRADGNQQFQEVKDQFARFGNDPYVETPIVREPLRDHVEFAIIGGGFTGLLAGVRLREAGFRDIRIIEKGSDFGGTWYWNRYPGAMCDVESYIYIPLLEELGHVPRQKYADADEILRHALSVARRFSLYENACLQTSVTKLVWDEAALRWLITTDRGDEISASFVLLANGTVDRPKLPGIAGINTFRGHSFHTSRWDYKYTGGDQFGGLNGLEDKRVGVIGTGATAVQCIPHLGEWAKQLYVFQRTPSAVDVRNNASTDPAWVGTLSPGWQKDRIDNFNAIVYGGEDVVDLVSDGWTHMFGKLTGVAARRASQKLGRRLTTEEREVLLEEADFDIMENIRARVDAIVKDRATAEALKPWYGRLCKRPCFQDGYLETFNRSNVTLVDTNGRGVDRITSDSVIAVGRSYQVDCLIFATGFEIGTGYTRRSGYEVVGHDGLTLTEKWSEGYQTFHGLFSRSFPNCFFLGISQNANTYNYLDAVGTQVKHAVHILRCAVSRGIAKIECSESAEAEWVAEIKRLARGGKKYHGNCTPGYYNNEGNVDDPRGLLAGAYGEGPLRFYERMANWRDAGDMAGLEMRGR